jgi:hypothetical protein
MENEKIISPLLIRLEKQFALQADSLPAAPGIPAIKEALINRIIEMMHKDYPKFLNALYLLDISEDKISRILYSKEKESIPGQIADLIIERQIQKIITQQMYKDGKI